MSNLIAIAYDDLDEAIPEISRYGGHVIQSSLSNETEAALEEALDARGVATA